MSAFTPNLWERALAVVAPARAVASYQARLGFQSAGQYIGARSEKTSMRSWRPGAGSADTDTIGDLPTLRARSRDLVRNDAIAKGARNTSKTNIVGTGLRVRPQLQREFLGLSDEAAEAWEDRVEVLFDLWANSKLSDATRVQNFYELQGLAFTSAFESGDVFALRRYKEDRGFLGLCLQLVEADRVCTPPRLEADPQKDIRDGVEVDSDGAPVAYWLRKTHPGEDPYASPLTARDFESIPAAGGSGLALMLHLFERDRIGLSRGVPALAPVVEELKQLSRYSEAELMAAVVSAFFTVFIKHTGGGGNDVVGETDVTGEPLPSNQMALGSGSIVDLGPDEDITMANPNRPNPNFEKFYLANLQKIGIALGIPYEVLISHFTASYSASRAALETAWQFFMERRTWLARNFCQPTYEWFLHECIARGLITAPGFLEDPIKRAAWCGALWIGPAKISLDETKDAAAAEAWIDLGVKTIEDVVTEVNGGDWFRKNEQRGREIKERERTKASVTPAKPEVPKPEPKPAAAGAA